MIWLLYIAGMLLGLLALFLLWGFLHLRQSFRKALAEIKTVEIADIATLAQECVDVFQQKLDVRLDLEDCDEAAEKLDKAFRDAFKLKEAFARDDFYWYFAKPVGAFLGELLRLHAKHEWHKESGKAPSMEIDLPDGSAETFPFEKVLKHGYSGDAGDLIAYVAFARGLEQAKQA
jgi:hypothetical protein